MGLTLQNLRDKLRRATGEDSTELDDTEADLILNQSLWEIADVFHFREAETSREISTVAGTVSYAVAADHNATETLSIEDDDTDQRTRLLPMSEAEYENNFVDTTAARAKPTHYFRRGGNIILWPTPDAVYTIVDRYKMTLADLISGGPLIPHSWDELIFMGAVFRRFIELGDVNRAYAYRKLQGLPSLVETKEETKSKELKDTQMPAVKMMRPKYP